MVPEGVVLRDFFDPPRIRADIFRRVQENFHKRFPLENDRVKIDLLNSAYDPKKLHHSLDDYQDAVISGGSMRTPLRGRVRLTDKAKGTPLDEKEITLANVPYMSDDGTFVLGGNHYVTNNQSRLKPGIYARRKENGELESHLNVRPGTGQSMRLFMEPETGVFRVSVNNANIKLYPVLKGLGVSDPDIEKHWGPEITAANRKATDTRAFGKFYDKLAGTKANALADDPEKAKTIQEQLNRMEFDPEVNTRTLGMTAGNNSTPVMLRASQKLLHISRNEEHEDDRDHPANRTFHSVDDFLADRVAKDAGGLGRTLLYRATYDRSLKYLRPGYFTPQMEGLLISNSLSSPLPGINPIETYDQQRRVVQLGEGGISSLESVPMSSRAVHPGQLGLIDPIRSAESSAVGVDQRFAVGARKGSDNQVYFPLRNRKTGKTEYMSPVQLHGKVVAFPKGESLEPYKTPVAPPAPVLKIAAFEELAEIVYHVPTRAEELLSFPKTGAKAVDLDGTLAFYPEGVKGIPFIGKPIGAMMARVKRWLADGERVVIFTARAHDPKNIPPIKEWLKRHGLPPLMVTNQKLPWFSEVWDDKAVGVHRNKGTIKSGVLDELQEAKAHSDRHDWKSKHRILRKLIQESPDDWEEDSRGLGVSGVTHRPTGFRFHMPSGHIPKAADLVDIPESRSKPSFHASKSRPEPAVRDGKLTMVLPHEADYEFLHPSHHYTDTTNLIPMVSALKGARVFSGSKYVTQALPLVNPDTPLVNTMDPDTGESVGKTLGHKIGIVKSQAGGRVKRVTEKLIDVEDASGKVHRHDLKYFFPHNRKTGDTHHPVVQEGQEVEPGDILAHNDFTDPHGHLAIGKNLRVGFLPKGNSETFEDAISVSESASKKMTSKHLYGYDVEHKVGMESGKSKFISLFPNLYTKEQLDKIGENGMAKPGVELRTGDPFFLSYSPRTLSAKDQALGNLHKVLRDSYEDHSHQWEKVTPGKIVHARELRNGLAVRISTHMPLAAGDKISGRNASKGVVSRIVPDSQMIHDAEGRPMDIIINPQAMVGRVVPGMAYEALLGKIAAKHGKQYTIPAFHGDDGTFHDFVQHELAAHGEKDQEDLVNPMTGRSVPGVLTGYKYFMKLEHTADSKLSGRGDGGYDLNQQPTKGGDEGAKRLGGLQNMALLSHGATDVLRDAHVYRGSNNEDTMRRIRLGHALPAPKVPFIYEKFLNSLKAAGINVKKEGTKVNIMGMTDHDIDKLALNEVLNSETIDPKTGEPVKGGLMDFAIHGGPEGTGWSHIKLDHPIPNPLMEDPIRRLLGLTEPRFREILAGRDRLNGQTGPEALVQGLKGIDLDKMEEDDRETVRSGRKTKRDTALKQLRHVVGLKRAGMSPSDLLISKVPVLPPTYRPVSAVKHMILSADANYLYKDLMSARDAYRANKSEIPEEQLGDERLGIYDAIKAIQGLGDPISAETAAKGVKGFIRQVAGVGGPKTGMFISKVIGHPVNTVGRSVIVPNGELNMDEIGIPEKMAWSIFEPFVSRRMVRQGMPSVEAMKHLEQHSPTALKHLLDEMEHRPVMYSRDPALHRFSIMGAKGRLIPGSNIQLSPLVVKPFGADFDGDQMNIHVPISEDARLEILHKMMPSQNLFDLKQKQVHFLPSQESVLGLANLSTPHLKKQKVIFHSKEEALKAYRSGVVDIDQPIEIVPGKAA